MKDQIIMKIHPYKFAGTHRDVVFPHKTKIHTQDFF